MPSVNVDARSRGRKRTGSFKVLCTGLVLGASLGYGMLRLSEVAPVRGYACAKLPALSHTISCYE